MADQSNDQIPVYPYTNSIPSQEEGTYGSAGAIPSYEPPVVNPPLESPTVVVSNNNGNVPKWFYFLFIVTLIVFFIVTALLVLSYAQKKSFLPDIFNKSSPTIMPTNAATPSPTMSQEATISLNPTLVVTPSIETWRLPDLTVSDELSDLEKDVNGTDISQIEKTANDLDRVMNFSVSSK